MRSFLIVSCVLIVSAVALPTGTQNHPSASEAVVQDSNQISADYPRNRAGVLIGDKQWTEVVSQTPSKTKVAHGIVAGLSYGALPAKIVAEYPGEHSSTVTAETQPIICICHFNSLPGPPVLVRLHAKKDARELDGSRMTVYPVVGGSKMADANKTDLVAAVVSQPEPQVWLVRPQIPLDSGEYALMLGTQNINVFPFTVKVATAPPSQ